jgi:hypothetical protein
VLSIHLGWLPKARDTDRLK